MKHKHKRKHGYALLDQRVSTLSQALEAFDGDLEWLMEECEQGEALTEELLRDKLVEIVGSFRLYKVKPLKTSIVDLLMGDGLLERAQDCQKGWAKQAEQRAARQAREAWTEKLKQYTSLYEEFEGFSPEQLRAGQLLAPKE